MKFWKRIIAGFTAAIIMMGFTYMNPNNKYNLLSIITSAAGDININQTTFPDSVFKAYVTENIDTDKNGILSISEINQTKRIDVCDKNITSLKGIEYFSELETLLCWDNNIESIDISRNLKLKFLLCDNNKITSLDISNNTSLEWLLCAKNKLTSLDISKNSLLTDLHCYSNQLTSLDVTHNPQLVLLWCYRNQISNLDLSNNTLIGRLDCSYNNLTTLNLNRNTSLTEIICGSNQLTSLDVSNISTLKDLNADNNSYNIGKVLDRYSLSLLPNGFDSSKTSNWSGATYDNTTNSIKNFTCNAISYLYDCGKGKSVTFKLIADDYQSTQSTEFEIKNGVLVKYTGTDSTVYIPDSVVEIGDKAFQLCGSIEKVVLPDSVRKIGKYAFSDCPLLCQVSLGNEIESIGDFAFNYCSSLKALHLPNNIISIGKSAFANCITLTEATIPSSVESIGNNAFDACFDLVLWAIQDSYAANYAISNNIKINYIGDDTQIKNVSLPLHLGTLKKEKTIDMFYSDNFFAQSANEFNYNLSKLSSIMATSAYSDSRHDNYFADKCLSNLGFDNISDMGSYEKIQNISKNNCDYVAYTFARKKVLIGNDIYDLIAVVIKGTGSNAEWYSNFNVGEGNDKDGCRHYGFNTAAGRLEVDFNNYISKLNLDSSKLKVWITGHSRGAAVGNLFSADLTNLSYNDGTNIGSLDSDLLKNNNFLLSSRDIYSYLYAVPSVEVDTNNSIQIKDLKDSSSKYSNIFNYINPQDFVPRMPLQAWNYAKYGKVLTFPNEVSNTNNKYSIYEANLQASFDSLFDSDLIAHLYNSGTAETLALCKEMGEDVRSVDDYYNFYYYPIFDPVKIILNLTGCSAYNYFYNGLAAFCGGDTFSGIYNILKAPAFPFTYYSKYFIFGSVELPDIKILKSDDMLREICLRQSVTYSHTPETYIAWSYVCDSLDDFANELYTCLEVKCPVNVEIYDSSNNLVGRVIDNKIDEDVTTVAIYVDETTNSKYIYGPADETYTVKAIGYDEGTMDYSVSIESIDDLSVKEVHSVEDIIITPNTVVETSTETENGTITLTATTPSENHEDNVVEYTIDENNVVTVEETPREHVYSDEWHYDGTKHWHQCDCGHRKDEQEHDSLVECSICGYKCDHSECESEITYPTKTEQGYTTHTCLKCGTVFVDSYTDYVPLVVNVELSDNSAVLTWNEFDYAASYRVYEVIDGEETMIAEVTEPTYTLTDVTDTARTIRVKARLYDEHLIVSDDVIISTSPALSFDVEAIADQTYTGSELKPTVVVKDGETTLTKDTDYTVEYSNNINVGTATVTVTGTGSYDGVSKTSNFTIMPKSVSLAEISAISPQIYTGTEITPEFTVTDGTKKLTSGTDYTVSWKSNVNVGTAVVTVSGKGNYKDTKSAEFEIKPKNINLAAISPIADQKYTGKELKPDLTVKDGKKILVKDTDFTVKYSNNIEVGEATVTIAGKNNYTGTNSASFQIFEKGFVVEPIEDQIYTGNAITPEVVIKEGGNIVSSTQYEVTYSDNINAGTATVTITGKAEYDGIKRNASFKIIGKSISSATVSETEAQVFTGTAITPVVSVKDGSKTLQKDTDYTVDYENNINAGTATILIIGIGNYADTKRVEFEISPKTAELKIAPIEDQTYTGSEIIPDITVQDGDVELTKDTDYTIKFKDNIEIGTATVTVTGKGNYIGTASATFKIVKSETNFTVDAIAIQTYTGSEITPEVTVKSNDTILTKDTDYTVDYSDNINVGEASVIITGIGSYKGIVTSKFIINAKSIDELAIASIEDQPFTGDAITPSVTIKYGEITLVKDIDYTVIYTDNINAGKATVTITGTGNYTGNQTVFFNIIEDRSVQLDIGNPGDGDYSSVTDALKYISDQIKHKTAESSYTINIGESLTENKALKLPKSDVTIKIRGGKLILKSPTITANSDLILDCEVIAQTSGKIVAIKAAAGKTVTIDKLSNGIGNIKGTKTSHLIINDDLAVTGISTFADVSVAEGRFLTVKNKGKITGINKLNGSIELSTGSAATVVTVEKADITLIPNNNGILPKVTVTSISEALNVKVNGTLKSGTTILTAAKDGLDTTKITVVHDDATTQLKAFLYKKAVRAEVPDMLSIAGKPYPTFEKAFEAMTNSTGNYTITLNDDISVSKLTLPKQIGSLTINGGKELIVESTVSLKASYPITIENTKISAVKSKDLQAVTITANKGLTLKDVEFNAKAVTVNGKECLTLGNCKGTAFNTISGFTEAKVIGKVKLIGKFTVSTVKLEEDAELTLANNSVLTAKTELSGAEGSKIVIESGAKPITATGKISGNITLSGALSTIAPILTVNKNTSNNELNRWFTVSGGTLDNKDQKGKAYFVK